MVLDAGGAREGVEGVSQEMPQPIAFYFLQVLPGHQPQEKKKRRSTISLPSRIAKL
jgi:hypothetical protein